MKKILLDVLALFFFSFTVLAQPKLVIIGGDVYDWKEVKVTEGPLKAKIQIKNEGDELLKIDEVKPGCGCTTAPLDKNELKPGEVATLNVTFNINSYSGNVAKSISIRSNDPKAPRKFLEIRANVIREIILKPSTYMAFRDLQVGRSNSTTMYIKNNSQQKINFSNLRIVPEESSLKLNITSNFSLDPGQEMELIGTMTPTTVGYQNCKIVMDTDHPDFKTLSISAYGTAVASPYFQNEKK